MDVTTPMDVTTERTIERLLSVDQTCRLQRRSLYGYISDVLAARTRGDPIPTLA
jgi:hypothetical protein